NLTFFIYLSGLLLAFLIFFRAFQPKIDHFFQRRRYDLEAILSRFIDEIIHLKGIGKLSQRIQDTIKETLYPQKVDILICNQAEKKSPFLVWLAKNNKIVYSEFIDIDPGLAQIKEAAKWYFDNTSSVVVIPLVLGDDLLGLINLGKKANLKRYSAVDFHFLNILRNQSAIAISNSLVYENIEEQVRVRTEELVEVQNQLTQAAKLASVGTLAGGVAHEINNPLAAILTNAQMLLASLDDLDADELKDSLELIEEATKRCRVIVKKLMTYARKPMEVSEVVVVDLLEVVEKVNSFLGYQLQQENITIAVKAEEAQYPAVGNHNEFEQVVTNLVLNAKDAIKRVKKSGQVEISLSKNDNWIRLDIKDEGSGIPKDDIPKIFDPFFTTKDVGKGLGLGLSISQSIIEKYKGSIFLKSKEGEGTTFTVNLPLAG
ncbi:MAG: GHKL domain-containing protein, partial [Candidatus Omnitrophica bacterium]|nr:GHKL domain-containing protein [Candidatus Omnitrophota bacterium]